jgi:acetoacetyl-CoA synthetase
MEDTAAILWTPTEEFKKNSNLFHFLQWVNKNRSKDFTTYDDLWEWSTNNLSEFWQSIWDYFDIQADGEIESILSGTGMPHYEWFTGTRLNYAEHIFRKASNQRPAILATSENNPVHTIGWQELENQVSSLQQFLQHLGVKAGDRIAAYMPSIPEATVAFLATNSLGAIWSSCSPDFGTNAVIDRFAQIDPKVLVAVDHYTYNGKSFTKKEVIEALYTALPSLESIIILSSDTDQLSLPKSVPWKEALRAAPKKLHFERVLFSHPMWILYSSGTTGLPKAITHSHGGILLEQLKYLCFHGNIKEGDRCFWYTTTGWMMWNYIQGSLLCGGVLILYDGSPSCPDMTTLWKLAAELKITHLGISAAFIMACTKSLDNPGKQFNLDSLQSIGSTGSTLPREGFEWIYTHVKKDVWLASISGGTDVCSAFVGGNPLWPVYSGEIQCRALGCRLEAFNDEGKPVEAEVGEMVITQPMPSMPVYFWNDPEGERYEESYFNMFPTIWRHGDWIEITPRKGIIIHGRSDATLNRGGVRIGTSEVYRALDKLVEIKDSLIVCIEERNGQFWMPLFIVLKENQELSDELIKKINTTLRTMCSPRHVPDDILEVHDIPYTISGKKTEMPVKKILMGKNADGVLNTGALRNPASLDVFKKIARERG